MPTHPLDRTRKAKPGRRSCQRVDSQLDLFPALLEQSEDEANDDLLTQRVKWCSASQASIPKEARKVASSVFDLASAPLRVHMKQADKPRKDDPVFRSRIIDKGNGRRIRVMIDERDTPEWQEREYQRRARQILPPPPMSARTKGEKLKSMTGGK